KICKVNGAKHCVQRSKYSRKQLSFRTEGFRSGRSIGLVSLVNCRQSRHLPRSYQGRRVRQREVGNGPSILQLLGAFSYHDRNDNISRFNSYWAVRSRLPSCHYIRGGTIKTWNWVLGISEQISEQMFLEY